MKSPSNPSVDASPAAPAAPAGAGASRFARIAIAALVIGLLVIGGAVVWHRVSAGGEKVVAESRIAGATGNAAPLPAATPAFEPRLQDRMITDEQRSRFVDTLRDAPRGQVFVSAVQGDREAYLYAAKLASMLREAGFASDHAGITFLPETEAPQNPPVLLFVSGQIPIRPHALAIKNALDVIGIRCDFSYRETPGRPGDLQIAVYPKPDGL